MVGCQQCVKHAAERILIICLIWVLGRQSDEQIIQVIKNRFIGFARRLNDLCISREKPWEIALYQDDIRLVYALRKNGVPSFFAGDELPCDRVSNSLLKTIL